MKDIYEGFIEAADRINFMVLVPACFDFAVGTDSTIEIASSQTLETIKLYYKHKVVTESIGLVFTHGRIDKQQINCSQMLK